MTAGDFAGAEGGMQGVADLQYPHGIHRSATVRNRPRLDTKKRFERLIREVVDTLRRQLGRNDEVPLVAAAVSGGADSSMLALTLAAARELLPLEVHVLHLDHGVRDDSGKDAAYAEEVARSEGLQLHVAKLDGQELLRGKETNRQAAMRRARYEWLSRKALELAGPVRTPVLATGHHAGDQTETLLLNLVRGAHWRGLRGIRSWQTLPVPFFGESPEANAPTAHLYRPLLTWERSAIEQELRRRGRNWVSDPSNAEVHYARNRLRRQVIPILQDMNPEFVSNLSRQSRLWAAEIDEALSRDAKTVTFLDPRPGCPPTVLTQPVLMDRNRYLALSRHRRMGALHAALHRLHGASDGVTRERLEHLDAAIQERSDTGGPWQWYGKTSWSCWALTPKCRPHIGFSRPVFSLHLQDSVPFEPDVPLLPCEDWVKEFPLREGEISFPSCRPTSGRQWTLVLDSVDANSPADWPQEARLSLAAYGEGAVLRLAGPGAGKRMQPLGMQGHHKSLRRILRDRKIHPTLFPLWPVLYDSAGVPLWLCGLHVDRTAAESRKAVPTMRLRWLVKKQKP